MLYRASNHLKASGIGMEEQVSPPKSLSAYFHPPIREATLMIVALATYLAVVAIFLSNVRTLSEELQYLEYAFVYICILLPLPIFLAGWRWIHRKKRWALQRPLSRQDTPSRREPAYADYFRLSPYVSADLVSFHRMDNEHVRTLEWISSAASPLLYLSGLSGTGKSSLLRAYVLPHLRMPPLNFQVIEVQSSNNPIQELALTFYARDRTSNVDVKPELIVNSYLKELDQRGNILIFFDQFERFLVHGREWFQAFEKFLAEAAVYQRLKLLIVIRSDYLSLIQDLNMPMLKLGDNWKEVGLFTDHAARTFFREAGIGLDDELTEELLKGASKLERNVGLYRPITLNMIGILVNRFGKSLPPKFEPGELIQAYLREAILDASVSGVAPDVIRKLLSRRGTKDGVTIEAIAQGLGVQSNSIGECLWRLEAKGLVRPLDDECSKWEISHDFVAQELRGIVGRIKPSVVKAFLPVGIAMTLLLWCLVVVVAPKYFDILSRAVAEAKLGGEGYLSEHQEVIRADALAMAADLNREGPALIGEPEAFQELLGNQAALRALTEAIVFLGNGQVVARTGLSDMLELERAPLAAFEQAANGEVVVLTGDAGDRVRALIRLQHFIDAFLFVGRYVNPELVRLTASDDRYGTVDAIRANWHYIYYTATALYLVVVVLQIWAFFHLRDYKV